MFKRVLFLLLILTILISVPVYGQEVYTLEPGKIYRFTFIDYADIVFSDNVLYGVRYNYDKLRTYDSYGNSYYGRLNLPYSMYVYNCSYSEIGITFNEGEIQSVTEYSSPFTLVMFDASEEVFEMRNISGVILDYKVHYYNEDNGSIDFNTGTSVFSGMKTLEGKGVLMFEFTEDELPYKVEFNGVYETGSYISEDFFPVPPWILRMDLTGTIRVLLDQLSMLLPVALVILLVFLLINLLIYIIHLFL